jgi:hypothetical protein
MRHATPRELFANETVVCKMLEQNCPGLCQAEMQHADQHGKQTHCGMDAKLIGAHKPMQHNGAPSCHKQNSISIKKKRKTQV